MKRALEPIGKSLLFSPCCRVTPVGIQWTRTPTDEELAADDYTIQRCDDSAGWWMGDIIVARWKREGKDKTLSEFAADYARARGLNEETVRQRANVGAYYPVVERSTRPITWSHHFIIWQWGGGDGLATCLKWLVRAAKGVRGVPWSTGRLREELRDDRRKRAGDDEPTPPVGEFEEMTKIECWAATRLPLVESIDRVTARTMLTRFAATAAFVDALRARANDRQR